MTDTHIRRPYLEHVDKIKDTKDLWHSMAFVTLWSIPNMISLAVQHLAPASRARSWCLDDSLASP